jgi:hypothetical protein
MCDLSALPRSFSDVLPLRQSLSLHSPLQKIHFAQRLAAAHPARAAKLSPGPARQRQS